MTIQKTLAVAMVLAAATSCIGPTVVAWRGIVHFNQQEATTEGRTVATPNNSSGSVEAPKTSDLKADVGRPAAQAAQAGEGRP